jgi:hypothetical protein
MEAAAILCPDAAALYRQGDEALEEAISQDQHRLSARAKRSPEIRPDVWLTLQLLDALRGRPDLQLTGRNPFAPLERRTAVTADVLRDACERDNGDHAIHRRWVLIDFRHGRASSGHDVPPTHINPAQDSHLADVRVEASSASPAQPGLPAGETDGTVRPEYTEDRGRQWLTWVRDSFAAEGSPMPPTKPCLAAAAGVFSGHIPRDPFYKLHKEVAGEDHRQGPQGPRNSARATAAKLRQIPPPQ